MTAISNAQPRYFATDVDADFERGRLRLLGALLNPMTTRRLDRLGVARGWRCLEVGAGDGAMARWLAARVGPEGHVVATDIDPRFLEEPAQAGIEVRRHDIRCDLLETRHYDLVHCRALLMHLPEPERALARMAAALRPGGWLLVEEGDMGRFAVMDPRHPAAATFDRIHRTTAAALATRGHIDVHLGRRCRGLLERLGLAEVGDERTPWLCRGGGSVGARFQQMSARLLWQDTGMLSEADYTALLCVYADPSFAVVPVAMVGAWGRRAQPGS